MIWGMTFVLLEAHDVDRAVLRRLIELYPLRLLRISTKRTLAITATSGTATWITIGPARREIVKTCG